MTSVRKKARLFSLAAALLLCCTSCSANPTDAGEMKRYSAQFLTLFDTVTTVVGYAHSKDEFSADVQRIYDGLEEYHQLFDIYETYDGIANLKTVNDMAGKAPVTVDRRIIDLLLFCRDIYDATGGKVNVVMGSVLSLWHGAREAGVMSPENAAVPERTALEEAAEHTGFDLLIIDEEASAVFLTDPAASIDVGAVAKGYAAEQVLRGMKENLLISIGGHIVAKGANPAAKTDWVVGVQKPGGGAEEYLHTLYMRNLSAATSGDYQRFFVADGVRYHHIIDPDTLYPAAYWQAVTVVAADSAAADALSTAVYLLPLEEGKQLIAQFGAEALWIARDGSLYYSDGFPAYIKT